MTKYVSDKTSHVSSTLNEATGQQPHSNSNSNINFIDMTFQYVKAFFKKEYNLHLQQ